MNNKPVPPLHATLQPILKHMKKKPGQKPPMPISPVLSSASPVNPLYIGMGYPYSSDLSTSTNSFDGDDIKRKVSPPHNSIPKSPVPPVPTVTQESQGADHSASKKSPVQRKTLDASQAHATKPASGDAPMMKTSSPNNSSQQRNQALETPQQSTGSGATGTTAPSTTVTNSAKPHTAGSSDLTAGMPDASIVPEPTSEPHHNHSSPMSFVRSQVEAINNRIKNNGEVAPSNLHSNKPYAKPVMMNPAFGNVKAKARKA
ncbi:uncharacterized protein LOC129568908 [Sitodiplosis mosellana]|uniref:uncharacterized protein LOC129568908 n=1 Tax=Sitodiplosis mosellana TaxID=263140 RepID=UPI0024450522|nr:uncharacterized protein LOC129568908 [Sitodiplosis mosellana]